MKKTKLILVGNGMAGVRTLEELLKLAPDLYDITVYGAEPHGNYNRILLSPVLAGEMKLPEIMLNDLDWYRDNGITLHAGKKIDKIDRIRRILTEGPPPGDVQLFSQLKALGEIKAALAGIPDPRARELEQRVAALLEASFKTGRFANL